MAPSSEADATLVSALNGDKVAQQILLMQYYDLIASVAWTNWPTDLHHVLDQEDLVQDILARVLKKLDTVDRSRLAEFPGWLKMVAASEVADKVSYWRAYGHGRVPTSLHDRDGEGPGLLEQFCVTHSLPEKPARLEEAKRWLLTAMENLASDQREAVHRKYFAGETHPQIAAAMQRSPGAVRELLRRAEENLEKQIGTASHWLSSR